MPQHDLVLGLDVGTTNLKCLALDGAGNIVAQGSEPTPQSHPRPGWTDFEPERIWKAACAAIRSVVSQIENPAAIRGIAVSSLAESVVPIDSHGQTLAPSIAWFDLRTTAEYEWIRETVGYETLFKTTGLNPDPMFGLCKILWVKKHNPVAFQKAWHWLHFADYVAFRLCGIPATDPSLACRSLAYDLGRGDWSSEILEAAGLPPSAFPPVCQSGTPLGLVKDSSATATNLPNSTVVSVGIHDQLSGAFAAGGLSPGVLFDGIGTSESLNTVFPKPVFDQSIAAVGLAQGALWIDKPTCYLTGGILTAGAAIEWFRRELGGTSGIAQLVDEAAGADQAVPMFLPHLIRSLTPHPDTQASGAFIGIQVDDHPRCHVQSRARRTGFRSSGHRGCDERGRRSAPIAKDRHHRRFTAKLFAQPNQGGRLFLSDQGQPSSRSGQFGSSPLSGTRLRPVFGSFGRGPGSAPGRDCRRTAPREL